MVTKKTLDCQLLLVESKRCYECLVMFSGLMVNKDDAGVDHLYCLPCYRKAVPGDSNVSSETHRHVDK